MNSLKPHYIMVIMANSALRPSLAFLKWSEQTVHPVEPLA